MMSWTLKLSSLSLFAVCEKSQQCRVANRFFCLFVWKRKSYFPGWTVYVKKWEAPLGSVRSLGLVCGKTGFTLILICWGPWASYFTPMDFCFSYLWHNTRETGWTGFQSCDTLCEACFDQTLMRLCCRCSSLCLPWTCVQLEGGWLWQETTRRNDPHAGLLGVYKWTVEDILLMCILSFPFPPWILDDPKSLELKSDVLMKTLNMGKDQILPSVVLVVISAMPLEADSCC